MKISLTTVLPPILVLATTMIDEAIAQPETGSADGEQGIYRMWSVPSASAAGPSFSDFKRILTEDARAETAAYGQSTINAQRSCDTGMPSVMFGATPIAFSRDDDRIMLRLLDYGIERTVYMDPEGDGVEEQRSTPSALGHSVGYWDHGVLMIGTTSVDWRYFDSDGTPVSDQAEFIERFTHREEENRLYYRLTVIDRETFTGPVVVDRFWEWELGVQIEHEPFDCSR